MWLIDLQVGELVPVPWTALCAEVSAWVLKHRNVDLAKRRPEDNTSIRGVVLLRSSQMSRQLLLECSNELGLGPN